MKKVKQLLFKSWNTFREWYTRMKESFKDLSLTFLKILHRKFNSTTILVVVTY
jgi:hypothetical protein